MRAVVQRVSSARVEVDGEVVGTIGRGLLVYLGAGSDDDEGDVGYIGEKVAGLRIFEEEGAAEGKARMTRSVVDVGGEVLVVSQFTLFGDVRRGRRPSFSDAAEPKLAERLYEEVVARLRQAGLTVATGRFRAMMDVHAVVAGPVTILLDSRKLF